MALMFLGKQHEQNYLDALERADATTGSKTIQAVLYVLTSIPSVAEKLDEVFNFQGRYINPDFLEKSGLSKGERILVALAMNIFNGYEPKDVPTSPAKVMGMIDSSYKRVYLSALEYRFV